MWIPNWRSVFKRGLWFSIAESWVCCVLFSECFLFCFVCFVLICIGFTFFIIIKFNVARRSAFPSETAEWAFWSFTRTTTNFQWTTTTRCSWWWSQCRWCCTSRIKSTHWMNINFVFVFFCVCKCDAFVHIFLIFHAFMCVWGVGVTNDKFRFINCWWFFRNGKQICHLMIWFLKKERLIEWDFVNKKIQFGKI